MPKILKFDEETTRRTAAAPGTGISLFIIDQVLPRVESAFRVARGTEGRSIAGSSMGGLVSLYALWKHPDVFGAAAALSPSVWLADEAFLGVVARRPLPQGRLWLDAGTGEGDVMLDSVRRLRDALEARGLTPGPRFEYVEDEGATHQEEHWGRRMRRALPFLVGPSDGPTVRPSDATKGATMT